MEENSSSQMGRFCSQWLPENRFPCRDSENSSDYSIWSLVIGGRQLKKFPAQNFYQQIMVQRSGSAKDFSCGLNLELPSGLKPQKCIHSVQLQNQSE